MREEVQFDDDEPSSRVAWLRAELSALAAVPRPGADTADRFDALRRFGRIDGSLGRLAEGHLDALAILAELGSPPPPAEELWGVWAARPDLAGAERTADGWHLRGRKPWCSGADHLDRALITATGVDQRHRLFAVDVRELVFDDDWRPMGMRASDSRTATLDVVLPPSAQVGAPGAYVERAGFGHGGVGVAAVWLGLAERLVADLARAAEAPGRPHLHASAGRAAAAAFAGRATLHVAAAEIDACPCDVRAATRRAPLVRVAIAELARTVLDLSTRAHGAGALCFDTSHARAVADLTVYLGQLHDGDDAAAIGHEDCSC